MDELPRTLNTKMNFLNDFQNIYVLFEKKNSIWPSIDKKVY